MSSILYIFYIDYDLKQKSKIKILDVINPKPISLASIPALKNFRKFNLNFFDFFNSGVLSLN